MPVYDFTCAAPEAHTFEARAGFDEKRVTCPICGEDAVRNGIQRVAGVLFKGGGFTRPGA